MRTDAGSHCPTGVPVCVATPIDLNVTNVGGVPGNINVPSKDPRRILRTVESISRAFLRRNLDPKETVILHL